MKLIDCYNFYIGGKQFRNFVIIKHISNNKNYLFYYSTGTSNKGINFPNCWFPASLIEPYGEEYTKTFPNTNSKSKMRMGQIYKKSGLHNKLKIFSQKNGIDYIKKIFNLDDINLFFDIKSDKEQQVNSKEEILKKDNSNEEILFHFLNKFNSWEELQISAYLSLSDDQNLWEKNKYFKEIRTQVLSFSFKNKKFVYSGLNFLNKLKLENVIVRKFSDLDKKDDNKCKGNFIKTIKKDDKYPKRFLKFANWMFNNIEESKDYFSNATDYDLKDEVLEILKEDEFKEMLKIYNKNKKKASKKYEDKKKAYQKLSEIDKNKTIYRSKTFLTNHPISNIKKAREILKKIQKENETDIKFGNIKDEDKIRIDSLPLSKVVKGAKEKLKILNTYIEKHYEKIN